MPLIETKGAASAQGFGLTLSSGPINYIEDVFSTYLYTGNGSTQTITNGIDLSGKGGMVWMKSRAVARNHALYDTARGTEYVLSSNLTNGMEYQDGVRSYLSSGFGLGGSPVVNTSAENYVSWTFRKQPKFFDVVTYTGNGSAGRTISHNLGSYPGCIIVKKTSAADNWLVWHRSLSSPTTSSSGLMWLNATNAEFTGVGSIYVPSGNTTTFTVASGSDVNQSGATYVAYLFAHNAGGFGLTGTDNVISCGSFTTSAGQSASVSLGWEPQWLLFKATSTTDDWWMIDTMRGFPGGLVTSGSRILFADLASAELNGTLGVNATGFDVLLNPSTTYIYIAIRRGPMKVPTSGTSVYYNLAYTGTGSAQTVTANFVPDAWWNFGRTSPLGVSLKPAASRLTGTGFTPMWNSSAQQGSSINWTSSQNSVSNSDTGYSYNAATYVANLFGRAPSFFDVMCYTGNGASNSQAHNLTVAPELVIIKRRNTDSDWVTLYGFSVSNYNYFLPGPNGTVASFLSSGYGSGEFLQSQPTSTQLPITSAASQTNASGSTYVTYLFATCPGVSKVGTYTGTGALQTINCGFTGGVRFVLIKRTDSTGDWYVYDSARGISSGNDPYLFINTVAAEVTGTNYVDTTSVGFQVTAAAPAGLNANGGTYIFLAIA